MLPMKWIQNIINNIDERVQDKIKSGKLNVYMKSVILTYVNHNYFIMYY